MLEDFRAVDFRCFESIRFEPSPGRTFVVGRNAQGKTSLLEAVCILLRLQSPRTSSLSEAVRAGKPGFSIDGRCAGTHLTAQWRDGTRRILVDSKVQSRSDDYLAAARVAWFANTDLALVRGGGSDRRRFLDFLGSQCVPGYRAALKSYERALRSRNALLRDGRPRREISAFDEPLCESGDVLLAARTALTTAISPLAATACAEISGEADVLEISLKPGAAIPMADALARVRSTEERTRLTPVGPHRDDLLLTLNGMDAGSFASEGQQRSIALALKLSQARHLAAIHEVQPVFLIDDVFGELDLARRQNLLAAIPKTAQTIITTTFLDWAGHLHDARIFDVDRGTIVLRAG